MKRHLEMVRAQVPGISNLAAFFHAQWGGDLREKRTHGLNVLKRYQRRVSARTLTRAMQKRYIPPKVTYDAPLDKSSKRAHYRILGVLAAALSLTSIKVRRIFSRGN